MIKLFKYILHGMRPLSIIFDVLLWPLTITSALWFRVARSWGVKNLPLMRMTLMKVGVYPLVNHYYDPLFDYRKITPRRSAISIKLDSSAQLALLGSMKCSDEWEALPMKSRNDGTPHYYYQNGAFEILDAECYYGIIRKIKPARILEVGSGFSTLLALEAIQKNVGEDSAAACKLTCIEPYERPFLESLDINLIRQKVEDVQLSYFLELESDDILFIDSSHVIRPGGDVLHLILDVLPKLKSGVWVHIHDIFLPDDYPVGWLRDEFRLWNEQYVLEAFLSGGSQFEIMVALNYLHTRHQAAVRQIFPNAGKYPDAFPGSFWIRKL